MKEWPFTDPENVATVTVQQIVHGGKPILLVSHDEEDGGWQFLSGETFSESDAMLVSLKQVFALDPTIAELANLPFGWQATRSHGGAPWHRRPA